MKKDNTKVFLLKDLSLYIHIPFCVKKCAYCDFLSAPANEETKNEYIKALIAEIKSYKQLGDKYLVKTIFIGGGTPSSLEGQAILDIMDKVREVFTLDIAQGHIPEITIEVNPGTLNKDKLLLYKKAGINRLSFGLQSTDNKELSLLGRIHTFEAFLENYRLAREVEFKNINIDLMSALPGQSLNNWMVTLEKVVGLQPEHISAYSLIIEEGTPFFSRYKQEEQDEELDRVIYVRTKEYLEAQGYYRYEISNYAKRGYDSKHNTVYWTGGDYIGLGLGASSLINCERFHNEEKLEEYLKISHDLGKLHKAIEKQTQSQQMEEFMFLGLRLCKGVLKSDFIKRFGMPIESIYGKILNQSMKEELIAVNGERIYLTDKGIDLSNMVMSRFLLDL